MCFLLTNWLKGNVLFFTVYNILGSCQEFYGMKVFTKLVSLLISFDYYHLRKYIFWFLVYFILFPLNSLLNIKWKQFNRIKSFQKFLTATSRWWASNGWCSFCRSSIETRSTFCFSSWDWWPKTQKTGKQMTVSQFIQRQNYWY